MKRLLVLAVILSCLPIRVSGQVAPPQFPDVDVWEVGIKYRSGGEDRFCSGVVVHRERVLTAGHCGCGDRGSYRVFLQDPVPVRDEDAMEGRLLKVDGAPILFDPGQCRGNIVGGKDLALLRIIPERIDDPPNCGDRKKFSCPSGYEIPIWELRGEIAPGKELIVVGSGRTERGELGVRYKARIPVASPDCLFNRAAFGCAPFAEFVLKDSLSAVGAEKDSCKGDSGAPVFLPLGNQMLLVAITSREATIEAGRSGPCGGGGVYEVLGRKSVQRWLAENGVLPPGATLGKTSGDQTIDSRSSTTSTVVPTYGALVDLGNNTAKQEAR